MSKTRTAFARALYATRDEMLIAAVRAHLTAGGDLSLRESLEHATDADLVSEIQALGWIRATDAEWTAAVAAIRAQVDAEDLPSHGDEDGSGDRR